LTRLLPLVIVCARVHGNAGYAMAVAARDLLRCGDGLHCIGL